MHDFPINKDSWPYKQGYESGLTGDSPLTPWCYNIDASERYLWQCGYQDGRKAREASSAS